MCCLGLCTSIAIAQNVTLNFKDTPLKDVLKEIQHQTDYRFVYNDNAIRASTLVTVSFVSQPLTKVLEEILTPNNISFTIDDKQIVLQSKPPAEPAKSDGRAPTAPISSKELRGRVIDASGAGLAGAFVRVKNNTSKNGVTDAAGYFYLKDIDLNGTIVISFMGFETKEVNLNGRAMLDDILLVYAASPIDEVQVIAYGTTTKRLNVGNVTTVKKEAIAQQPVTHPLMALSGRVPGLYITASLGLPGSQIQVQLQGQNSITQGNTPLYVIDGVPYDSESFAGIYTWGGGINTGNPLAHINPANIESIDILKDADATAIYGSRAANGAILITTQKGQAGRTKVEVDMQTGWGKVTNMIDLLNTEQYIEMRMEAKKNDNAAILATDYDINGAWDTNRYTDWQKELIGGTAVTNMLHASVSGGTTQTQFLVGATFRRESTVFPGDFADTKGSTYFNINHTSSNQKLRFRMSGSYLVDHNLLPDGDLTSKALYTPPHAPALYNPDGSLNWAPTEDGVSTWTNPLNYTLAKYLTRTNNLVSNAVLSYRIIQDLTVLTNLGYTNIQSNDMLITPLTCFQPEQRPNRQRTADFRNNNGVSWIVEPQATYNKDIWIGKLEALIGFSIQQNYKNGLWVSVSGHSSDLLLEDINSAPIVNEKRSPKSVYKYNALFGRLKYNVLNKYIVDLTARRDGSSRFGPENRFNNFWAIGAAWIFSEEQCIANHLSFLSYGKIRGSFGTTGNDQIGDYNYLSLYSATGGNNPFQGIAGIAPNRLPNPYMQWEETKKLQFGLDLGFIKDRILVNAGYYRNRSSNQLLGYALPMLSGFGSITMNFPALVENSGWELSLNTINVKTNSLVWNTGFNLTLPKNKLVDFPELETSTYANTYVIGKPITMEKLYHFLGVDPATGIYIFADKEGNPTSTPVSNIDRTVIQSTTPYFYGGLDNSVRYKNIELNVFFQFVKQDRLINFYGGQLPGTMNNMPVSVMQRWQKEGDQAPIQRFASVSSSSVSTPLTNARLNSDAAYGDGSFIRLKNASLSWQLPLKWVNKVGMEQIKLYVQGQNLFIITNYVGLDPDSRNQYVLPPLRQFTVGLKLGL